MGWKNIKQTYCPDFDVYVDKKEKSIQIYYQGIKVFMISTINFEITAEPIFKSSFRFKSLMGKLIDAKKKGELKRLYDTPDTFGKSLPVYEVKNRIIPKLCEEYGYGKPTHSGEKMLYNYFVSRKEAKKFLRKSVRTNLRDTFNYSFMQNFGKAFKGTWKLIKSVCIFIKTMLS